MALTNWLLKPKDLFTMTPVMPVIVINKLDEAVPLAQALVAGGIKVLEVTLRTPLGLAAIPLLKEKVPEAVVGAGTVTTPAQLQQCVEAGAEFVISPGITIELLEAGKNASIPLIPGIASVSELMEGKRLGYDHFKFFPAEAVGGIKMLKAIFGPFPDVRFCPTGGINEKNFLDYLHQPNVDCVGGSWIVPEEVIQQGRWQRIEELCSFAVTQAACINRG